ncbi:beta galactosidase jelly roll domain-containing protein, partial [bacterium]|nr:beta galactosidase jelly roll domain-containing protein [bacterium]
MTTTLRLWTLAAALAASVAWGAGRPTLPLDGAWQFRLDGANEGEAGRWFDPEAPFQDSIRVPGAWGAQGHGSPTDKVRHHFEGAAWYRRSVRVPDAWRHKRVFLTLGGVHRYAKVWVNGVLLGEHIGYLSAFEYEITPHIESGALATIAIRVDSKQRWEVDALTGACDIIDAMFIPWGGIWGHVDLVGRGLILMEELL